MPDPNRAEEKEAPIKTEPISAPDQAPEVPAAPEVTPEAVSAIEAEPTVEAAPEREPEPEEKVVETVTEAPVVQEPVTTPVVAPAPAPQKDRLEKEIEAIMEEDLMDLYLKLPPDKQQAFKLKGEETLGKIRQLVTASKVNAKKIFSLIRDWLKMVPGVNKFFLAQEAKIKTDKILLVTEEEKKRAQDEL